MTIATYNIGRVAASQFSGPAFGVDSPTTWNVYSGDLVIDVAGHPNSYRVKAICLNCKWEGQMRLAKGSLVTVSGHGVECPMCGCNTVTGGTLLGVDTPEDDSSTSLARSKERATAMTAESQAAFNGREAERMAIASGRGKWR